MEARLRRRLEERRRRLEPISSRGRTAALTVAACLLGGGVAALLGGWTEFWCALGGPFGSKVCDYVFAVGAVFVLGGAAAIVAGVLIGWRATIRPVLEGGGDGWVVAEGLLLALAGLTLTLSIPSRVCPAGYRLTIGVVICVSDRDRIQATSQVWLKLLLGAASVAVGTVVALWRRVPWIVASAATVATTAAAVGVVLSRTVGLPFG